MEHPVHHSVPTASRSTARHHRTEPGSILPTPPPQTPTDTDEDPSQSSLHKAEQAQVCKPLPISEMLQFLNHLCRLVTGLPIDAVPILTAYCCLHF